MDRPATSKPRGLCKYYNQSRGCLSGDKCKFLHGEREKSTPYDRAKLCRWYAKGYCRNGDKCWFRHIIPVTSSSTQATLEQLLKEDHDDNMCCICLEKPTTYGILIGCNHVFCNQCIRQWRNPEGKSSDVVHSGVTKKCPLCRAPSRFIVPSSHFFPHGSSRKEAEIETYKASMARTPCRYFEKSMSSAPFCPFGKDCFYRHARDDGSLHAFDKGVDHHMKIYARRRRQRRTDNERSPRTLNFIDQLGATINAIRARLPWEEIEVEGDNSEPIIGALDDFFDEILFGQQDVPPAIHGRETETHTGDGVPRDQMYEELNDDGLLPELSPLPESFRLSPIFIDEEGETSLGNVGENLLEGSSVDRSGELLDPSPTHDLTPSYGLPISTVAQRAEGILFAGNLERPATFPRLDDEDYAINGLPACRQCQQELQCLVTPDVSIPQDDVVPSSNVDTAVFGSRNADGNDTRITSTGPVMTIQGVTEANPPDICVAGSMVEQDETDGRSRVVWSGGMRGSVGTRCVRGRIGMIGGKTTVAEKSSREDGAAGEGFMTDGRGRVIGTSEEMVWEGEDFRDGEVGETTESE